MISGVEERTGAQFSAPRTSGTPGDDLIAWGLAILVSGVAGRDTVIRSEPERFVVDVPVPMDELIARCDQREPNPRLAVPWLASPEKDKLPPTDILQSRDRDQMRDDLKRLREARRSGADLPQDGDAAAMTVGTPEVERIYPLFQALTNPGTQWTGYNSFAELVQRHLLTPDGLRLILRSYDDHSVRDQGQRDQELKKLGLRATGDRWRNPPGFLFPGLNKGPTMRLHASGGRTVGNPAHADWMLADRGDRDAIQLYLAYVGYFAVARIAEGGDGRVVLVPSPAEVQVPAVFNALRQAAPPFSSIEDYLMAVTSLHYARAALTYWQQYAGPAHWARYPEVLAGVNVAIFWRPSGNTYAPRRQTMAPLPIWLRSLLEQTGQQTTRDTLQLHLRRLASVRGPWRDEAKLPPECREALAAYVASLSGEARDWLSAVRRWFPAARRLAEQRRIGLWSTEQIRRILMAVEAGNHILSIVEEESFQRVADAIRRAAVYAHFARLERRREGGEGLAFDPDYDLVTRLGEAADRHPEEFLGELYQFAARYNEQTMRRNENAERRGQPRRPMLRTDDLQRVTDWILADRRGLVPAALLAFGSSLLPRRQAEQVAHQEGVAPELVQAGAEATTDDTEAEGT